MEKVSDRSMCMSCSSGRVERYFLICSKYPVNNEFRMSLAVCDELKNRRLLSIMFSYLLCYSVVFLLHVMVRGSKCKDVYLVNKIL